MVSDNEEIISDEGKADFSNTERMSNEADSDVEMTLGEESSGNNVPNNLTMQFNEWGTHAQKLALIAPRILERFLATKDTFNSKAGVKQINRYTRMGYPLACPCSLPASLHQRIWRNLLIVLLQYPNFPKSGRCDMSHIMETCPDGTFANDSIHMLNRVMLDIEMKEFDLERTHLAEDVCIVKDVWPFFAPHDFDLAGFLKWLQIEDPQLFQDFID